MRRGWPVTTGVELEVDVHPTVEAALANPASYWWELGPAVARAWELAMPWIDAEVSSDPGPPQVRVVAAPDLAVGSARVTASGDGERMTVGCDVPFLAPESSPSITFEKWTRCGVGDPGALLAGAATRLGLDAATAGR